MCKLGTEYDDDNDDHPFKSHNFWFHHCLSQCKILQLCHSYNVLSTADHAQILAEEPEHLHVA
jgi:hypothetical protein